MIWYKYVHPSGYYYSPFSKSRSILKSYNSPEDMCKDLNHSTDHYNVITNNLAEIFEKSTPETPPEDLPSGIYSHEYGTNSSPERLVPLEIREDNYIELLSSLSNLNITIQQFIDNESLYKDSQSLYKLGILLFGPPGTGKTCYMRQLIRNQKDSIIIFLDGVPSRKFIEKLENSTKNRLKILVFEEVVSMVESSEDVRDMLDFLDGSKSLSNSIYFLSTNYPESIPENIIRNGRIDIFVKVDFPDEEARGKLINLYLKRNGTQEELLVTKDMPIVDIREICFLHKKTSKSFQDCAKIVEEKNKMIKKHFGKTTQIKLT